MRTISTAKAKENAAKKALDGKHTKKKKKGEITGRWTSAEHELFLQGLQKYGKEWKQIGLSIPTRTVVQVCC